MKTEFLDGWNYLNRKLSCPYEHFNSLGDYQKPVNISKNEDVLSIIKD